LNLEALQGACQRHISFGYYAKSSFVRAHGVKRTFAKVATVFQQHLLSGRIQMTIDKPSEVIHHAKIQDDVGHTEDCQ
jgi:hypothetical protein